MNIAVVEDDQDAKTLLISYLNKLAIKYDLNFNISTFENGLQIIADYDNNFDVIYFDVQMPGMDGMTTAKKIRAKDRDVVIIFVTNYVQWAIDGYAVNAFDFLLKPLSEFSFEEHFKKILDLFSEKRASFMLKLADGYHKIFLDNLTYVESQGHYLYFHTKDEILKTLGTMKEMENQLSSANFFRCNNGYLVNLACVDGVKDNLVLVNGDKLAISRPRKKKFLEALTNYLGNGGL